MSTNLIPPVVSDWLAKTYGGLFEVKQYTISTTLHARQAIPANPERVSLTVINVGTAFAQLTPNISNLANGGIILSSNGASVTMNMRDDFVLPTLEWFVQGSISTATLYVIEVNRFNPGGAALQPGVGGGA